MANDQLDIFGGAVPLDELAAEPREVRRGDPATSAQAASIPDRTANFAGVLRVLVEAGEHGCTDSELARALPHQHPGSVSKRRLRLERAGLVEDSGRVRPTAFGIDALVFVVTDKGKEVLRAWQQAKE